MRAVTLKDTVIHEQVSRTLFKVSDYGFVEGIVEQLVKDAEELAGLRGIKIENCAEQMKTKEKCDGCTSTIVCGKVLMVHAIIMFIAEQKRPSYESVGEACQIVKETLLGETTEEIKKPFKQLLAKTEAEIKAAARKARFKQN